MIGKSPLAGIEYAGLPGVSESCVDVIQRFIQYNAQITRARLLTCGNDHCFLLVVNEYDSVAVKSGFTSGYSGEGPKALARTLQLLIERRVDVEEIEVSRSLIDRVDRSALTERDIEHIYEAKVVRPKRIYQYIFDGPSSTSALGIHWHQFPTVIPFTIMDRRIADLTLEFFEKPGDSLLQGFRRLEDTVRQRIGSTEHGTKLFSQAFSGETAKLVWNNIQPSELSGRVNLFTGAYMAHRNPRAHREMPEDAMTLLSEFLLLNHLFRLESEAVPTEDLFRAKQDC